MQTQERPVVPPAGSPSSPPARTLSPARIAAVLATVALLSAMVGYLFGASLSGSARDAQAGSALAATDLTHPSIGDAEAPVTLVQYSDFKCPFCGRYAREVEPALIERYVEPGLLRIEWHDFPAQGSESTSLAIAARAADAQGRFWDFHEAVFADQAARWTDERIHALVDVLGLDRQQFEADVRAGGYGLAVRADYEAGMQAGVRGTPGFFVNGRPIYGAQPLSVFVDAIEDALGGTTSGA